MNHPVHNYILLIDKIGDGGYWGCIFSIYAHLQVRFQN